MVACFALSCGGGGGAGEGGAGDSASIPVFPGAVGYGTNTVAGSGRAPSPKEAAIIRVTSLADGGEGTLRGCVTASGPRTCVFEVGGAITLSSNLEISEPFLTIAGQTAPSPGITLRGATVAISTHDVLIRHLRIRVGDAPEGPLPSGRDGLALVSRGAVYNVVLANCSVSWALDENFSTFGEDLHDITLQDSILSQGLHRSLHHDGPHSCGAIVASNTQRLTIHGTLFAENNTRNPYVKPGVSMDFVNNIVFGWGETNYGGMDLSDYDGENRATRINIVSNVFLPAPGSSTVPAIFADSALAGGTSIFVSGNIGPGRDATTQSEWSVTRGIDEAAHRSLEPVAPLSVQPNASAADTLGLVVARAGARPADRDSVDREVIAQVVAGRGGIINCVAADGSERCRANAGGYEAPPETHRGLTLPSDPFDDDNGNGYTNLEDWLEQLSAEVSG